MGGSRPSQPRDRYPPSGGRESSGHLSGQRRAPLFEQRPPPRDLDDDGADGFEEDDENFRERERSYGNDDDYKRPTIRDELKGGDVLFGVFPILNSLKAQRRQIHSLYVLTSLDISKRKDAAALRQVFKLASEHDVPVLKVERHELNLLCEDKVHQGLVLDCSPLEWSPLDILPPANDQVVPGSHFPIWLALDEVQDPQNFGALVRSAHCLGAHGILVCNRNCAPLSATTSKASAGVLEVIPIHSCQNMPKTLSQAVTDGWDVLGASGGETGAIDCSKFMVTRPTVLVMGNEGIGLRTNIKRSCSGFVKVEMQPRKLLAADSLNVSVAAGILIHSLVGSAAAASAARQ